MPLRIGLRPRDQHGQQQGDIKAEADGTQRPSCYLTEASSSRSGGDEEWKPEQHPADLEGRSFCLPTVNFVFPMDVPPYYPRMHVVPDGRVLMTGPLALTQFLDTTSGQWIFLNDSETSISSRPAQQNFRDYAPSVLYDVGKILFIGGGNAPTEEAEILDLNDPMHRGGRGPTT